MGRGLTLTPGQRGRGAWDVWACLLSSLPEWGWWCECSGDPVSLMPPQLKKRALGLVRPKPVGGSAGDSLEQLLPEPCSGEWWGCPVLLVVPRSMCMAVTFGLGALERL